MNKKMTIITIIFFQTLFFALLKASQKSSPTDVDKEVAHNIIFNQILLKDFEKNLEYKIVKKKPPKIGVSIYYIKKNSLTEQSFLEDIILCTHMALLCKSIYNNYSVLIVNLIEKHRKNLLIRSFVTEMKYFSVKYSPCIKEISKHICEDIVSTEPLSIGEVQWRLYALLKTYGPSWDNTGYDSIKHRAEVHRTFQKNIILEMIKTKSFFLKKDLQDTLLTNLDRFEPSVFITFLQNNNAALVYINPEDNMQVNCQAIFQNPKFKKNIDTILNQLPDGQKFFFIAQQSEQ